MARAAALLAIVAVSVVTYLPAVDNFFISDDFTLLQTLEVLDKDPLRILQMPSELFRVASYVFFWLCWQTFGLNSEAYYVAGIGLHAIVALLVFALVHRLTLHTGAAWMAGMFFAAYERHQEAVMWISAFNDTILALSCVSFLLLWERAIDRGSSGRASRAAALLALAVALFSKEAAVALIPLAMYRLVSSGRSFREALRESAPLLIMLAVFVSVWLSQASKNFFIADGHYEFGLHFFPVYARSVLRLLSPALLLLVPLAWLRYRRTVFADTSMLLSARTVGFFALFVLLSVAPYSFLTYLDHIPSRNTYFPSVGLAGLMGLFGAALYRESRSRRMQTVCAAFMSLIVAGNVAYIWLKKEPQFRERSAPTRELIAALNAMDSSEVGDAPIRVCGFPLHEWIGKEAVNRFTPFKEDRVTFPAQCDETGGARALNWDAESSTYIATTETAYRPE